MATVVLSAAGAAIGGSIGGSVLGISAVAAGRLAGATVGRLIDQKLLGSGSDAVETGRVSRFRLTGASEGASLSRLYGRMRLPGQVIWASQFTENVTKSGGGGKGAPSAPETTSYSYSVSLAVALCEGEITRVGRVWADGTEVPRDSLNMRVYSGNRSQRPDPKIEAIEGAGQAPAYRGTAYVVFEDLDLGQFGNRVPQFSFEVSRPETPAEIPSDMAFGPRAVALLPGSGEYTLATTPVHFDDGNGRYKSANVNSPSGKTDFVTSVEALTEEMPNCDASSLIVSWFGDDLRAGNCTLRPKVEAKTADGKGMAWRVAGLDRASAQQVPLADGRPIYGGTPADAAVIEAIEHLRDAGQDVMFYPFILMDQQAGNGLPDPWGGAEQAALPWRGRITTALAPGQTGSTDGTAAAEAEVAAFFGAASAAHFTWQNGQVSYSGPDEWSFRRFILHNAALCAAAGGVDAFCIGSEMRGLTQIRGENNSFPAVSHLVLMLSEVRAILGPTCKLGYAADWSEYFGYMPQDGSGDRFFHLDPLWAAPDCDFVGIDNYMPLSDWREGRDHADAEWGSIYDLDYLKSNIEGGEGYSWYYHSPEARAAQIRTPITDGAHDEPWIWRYKDIRNWWQSPHHERIGGQRQETPTAWVPGSKPVWFTEYGCAAIDKGTNQPNKFLDPKSSESQLPRFSDGRRDDFIQMQYLRAMIEYWSDPSNNPVSKEYGGPMIDMSRAFVWAWDLRPYPFFPANRSLWSDGENYERGHWINGRATNRSLASVVAEICEGSGIQEYDVSGLYGVVRGYLDERPGTGRAALQPLGMAYGFDAVERDGMLRFVMRTAEPVAALEAGQLVQTEDETGTLELRRGSEPEVAGRVRLTHVLADGDFEPAAAEAVHPGDAQQTVAETELPLALTRGEGRQLTERWLAEARVARSSARFVMPRSAGRLGAGDVVRLPGEQGLWRIDRLDVTEALAAEAVRVDPEAYTPAPVQDDPPALAGFVPPLPVLPVLMDLPLMPGYEEAPAPWLAVTADPWQGPAAVYASASDAGYELERVIRAPAVMGTTLTPLAEAAPGRPDRGPALRVQLTAGTLASVSRDELLAGANLAAIGDGSPGNWELFQFASVQLTGPDTWDLSLRLRGQLGSDARMPGEWPAGSRFVLLNGGPEMLSAASAPRGVERHFRIGPARRPLGDASYAHLTASFEGVALQPLSPVHLRAAPRPDGGLDVTWIRRSRIDGDGWDGLDVPLGEESERYLVRVSQGGTVLREEITSAAAWTYGAAAKAELQPGLYHIDVAQISGRVGAGAFRRITLND